MDHAELTFLFYKSFLLPDHIKTISYARDGSLLAAACTNSITVVDIDKDDILSKVTFTDNIDVIEFTHNHNRLLYNVNKVDDNSIRLFDVVTERDLMNMSTNENIESISMSGKQNIFACLSEKSMIYLYDIRSGNICTKHAAYGQGVIKCHQNSDCLIAVNNFGISYFDHSDLSYGPTFTYIHFNELFGLDSCVDIAQSGDDLLITTKKEVHHLKMENMKPVNVYNATDNFNGAKLSARFNVDSALIFIGSTEGHIKIYETNSTPCVRELKRNNCEFSVSNISVNPFYMNMCSTAGPKLDFWQVESF